MTELLTSSLVIIATIVTIIAGTLTVLLIFLKNQFGKPKLHFTSWVPVANFEKNGLTKNQIKLIKENAVSIIAFAPQKKII